VSVPVCREGLALRRHHGELLARRAGDHDAGERRRRLDYISQSPRSTFQAPFEQVATSLPPHVFVNLHDWGAEHVDSGAGSWLGHMGHVPAMIIETVPLPSQKTVSLPPHAET
jgi:hypothetical protein